MSTELTAIAVRDFQSLKSVDIPVGRFTAIVGPSNVGKSAVIRALRMLVRNGAATGLVRMGAKKLTVAAKFADNSGAIMTRGGESKLTLVTGGVKQDYAKLGTTVPPESDDLWQCPESELGDLTFSTQHDAPFMLGVPSSAVAKQLGDLTNASLLMEAVREANRRRAAAAQESVLAKRDLEALTETLKAAVGLKDEKARLDQAADHLKSHQETVQKLTAIKAALNVRDAALKAAETAVAMRAVSDRYQQAIGQVQALKDHVALLTDILDARKTLAIKLETALVNAADYREEAERLRAQADEVLKIAGVCPVCGSDTK